MASLFTDPPPSVFTTRPSGSKQWEAAIEEQRQHEMHKPSASQQVGAYGNMIGNLATGGITGMLRGAGVQMPGWSNSVSDFMQSDPVSTAIGMALPLGGKPIPRIVSSPKMKEAILRNEWMRNGPALDFDDIPSAAWTKEVRAWNRARDFTQHIDPENYKGGSFPEFENMINNKYLEGNVKRWPGPDKANKWFADNDPDRAVFLSEDEAYQAVPDYWVSKK